MIEPVEDRCSQGGAAAACLASDAPVSSRPRGDGPVDDVHCEMPARGVDDRPRRVEFVYILSASHSGSTLLTMLLASHPQVTSVGETSAVLRKDRGDTGFCSCGATVADCPFWEQVRARMTRDGADWSAADFGTEFRFPGHPWADRVLRAEYRGVVLEAVRDVALSLSPAWRARSARLMTINRVLVDAVCALSGTNVFVDSSKEPHRLKFLMRIPSFSVKVIHLVRDGRGVVNSYIRRSGWPVERATDEWRRSIISEERLIRRLSAEQVIRLRYEDLCREPGDHLQRLFAFLDVDASETIDDFRGADHHILGNRMRMSSSSEIRLDERWRETLTPPMLKTFERLAGRINRRYGYMQEL